MNHSKYTIEDSPTTKGAMGLFSDGIYCRDATDIECRIVGERTETIKRLSEWQQKVRTDLFKITGQDVNDGGHELDSTTMIGRRLREQDETIKRLEGELKTALEYHLQCLRRSNKRSEAETAALQELLATNWHGAKQRKQPSPRPSPITRTTNS